MASNECQRCHRVFQRVDSEEVCPACAPLDEIDFKRIKEYLELHQGASSTEVMRETGVSLSQIKRYLREDRLEILGDNKGFIRCENCGAPINSGRYCDGCYKEVLSKKMIGVKVNKDANKKVSDKHKYLKE